MSNTTLLFVGIGIVIAIIGACIFQFNKGADVRTRQTGLVFFAVGLVIALVTAFTSGMPHHSR